MSAIAEGPNGEAPALTQSQLSPILSEAISRWQSAGADASILAGLNVQVTNLAGTKLGLASGNTIWLDNNAAGWGWFIDPTPSDDLEFALPGSQGEQNHMDLLSVVMHELGHLLGHEHEDEGLMAETLSPGVRHLLSDDDVALIDQVFGKADDDDDSWLGARPRTTTVGESL